MFRTRPITVFPGLLARIFIKAACDSELGNRSLVQEDQQIHTPSPREAPVITYEGIVKSGLSSCGKANEQKVLGQLRRGMRRC